VRVSLRRNRPWRKGVFLARVAYDSTSDAEELELAMDEELGATGERYILGAA
jgi:hypothetical protein